jgi:phosphatidylserine decarboxylase
MSPPRRHATDPLMPLSMFHFGGSTHCVLFEKGVKVSGFPKPSDHNVPVRSRLCVVE